MGSVLRSLEQSSLREMHAMHFLAAPLAARGGVTAALAPEEQQGLHCRFYLENIIKMWKMLSARLVFGMHLFIYLEYIHSIYKVDILIMIKLISRTSSHVKSLIFRLAVFMFGQASAAILMVTMETSPLPPGNCGRGADSCDSSPAETLLIKNTSLVTRIFSGFGMFRWLKSSFS